MTEFLELKDQTQRTEMTSTTVEDLWPRTGNMTTAADCNDPEQACYYAKLLRVVNVLDLYLLPLISVVGCIGNVLSFLVFTTTYLRRLSSSVYLSISTVLITSTCVDCPAASTLLRSPSPTPSFCSSYSAALCRLLAYRWEELAHLVVRDRWLSYVSDEIILGPNSRFFFIFAGAIVAQMWTDRYEI